MDRFKLKNKSLKHYRLRMGGLMLLADLTGFGLTGVLVFALNSFAQLFTFEFSDLKYLLVFPVCLALFASSRLYPGIGLDPPEEIRLVTKFISLSILIGSVYFFAVQHLWKLNYLAIPPAWGLSLLMVLLCRWGVRILASRYELWGEPVVVISSKERMGLVAQYFLDRRRLGFVPVLGVTEQKNDPSSFPIDVLDVEEFTRLPDGYFAERNIQTALVGTRILSDLSDLNVHRDLLRQFKRLVFVSDMDWLEGASISCHDFEGMLGIEARQNLLGPLDVFSKRAMDILFSILLGVMLLPIFAVAALVIRLNSPGPVFYTQDRIGKGGRRIRVHKLRTMVMNADRILEENLRNHPEARVEWEQTQKLKDDPRVTRPGKWLRRFSIDELPQLYNVLRGEMSVVGPRPMLAEQADLYGKNYELYCSVHPGLTGFWQVSGRNQTTFEERARFDAYYVNNWSVWLDIYILFRTVWVVLSRDGAY